MKFSYNQYLFMTKEKKKRRKTEWVNFHNNIYIIQCEKWGKKKKIKEGGNFGSIADRSSYIYTALHKI